MNNSNIFNAVLSGLAGATQSFDANSSSTAAYQLQADRSVILANLVDGLIAAGTTSDVDAALITQVTAGLYLNRNLLGITPNYTEIADNILVLYNAIKSRTVPEGVTPGQMRNAADYGVSSSNSAAQNSAILNSLLTTDGALELPIGDIYYVAPLSLNGLNNCVLRGVRGQTRLHPTGSRAFLKVNNCTNVQIEGLSFIGTHAPVTADADSGHGIYVTASVNVVIDNCDVTEYGANTKACNGIYFVTGSGNQYAEVTRCKISGGVDEYHGADILLGCDTCVVAFNFCVSSTGEGINTNGSPGSISKSIIVANVIANHTVHGILGQYGSMGGKPVNTVIGFNNITNCTASGVYCNGTDASNLSIIGNTISFTGGGGPQDINLSGGIYVEGSTASNYSLVCANTISDFGWTPAGALRVPAAGPITNCAAIRVSTRAQVFNNTIVRSAGYGITSLYGSWTIDKNYIYDTTNHGIYVDSQSNDGISIISWNTVTEVTSATAQCIYVRSGLAEYAAPPVQVLDNTLTQHMVNWVPALTYLVAAKAGNIMRNKIYKSHVGILLGNGEFFGKTQLIENNELIDCTYGIQYFADLHGVDRVTWGMNKFINTPNKTLYGGGTGVYYEAVRSWWNGTAQNVEVALAAVPVEGVWVEGDRILYTAPTAGGFIGEVCTTAPHTFKTYGGITP